VAQANMRHHFGALLLNARWERMITSIRILLFTFLSVAFAAPALAHPHVWVTMHTELVYAHDGRITGVKHEWAFDDMFSAFATQGLDTKEKGKFTREELAPLAQVNVESLKEYGYFTYATADGKKAPLTDPAPGYWLDYNNQILTLHFTLPFKTPLKAKYLKVEIYDPTIFVDFEFAKDHPVRLVEAPSGCKLDVALPHDISYAQSQKLGEAFFNQLNSASNWGAQFANKIVVNCP
jgi:ABC-type uncharacterized transport system substrate-binding protein